MNFCSAVKRFDCSTVTLNPWSLTGEKKKSYIIPPLLFDLSCSFVFSFRTVAFAKYPSLEKVEFISGQSFSEGTEEALIVRSVVDHEQDSGQQLIGYKQVVQVRPLVVPTAVATTPIHQGSEVILVPGEKFRLSPFNVNQALLVKTWDFTKLLPLIFEIHLKGWHLCLTIHYNDSFSLHFPWCFALLVQF